MQCVSRAGPSRTCALRKPWPISPSTALAGTRTSWKSTTAWPPGDTASMVSSTRTISKPGASIGTRNIVAPMSAPPASNVRAMTMFNAAPGTPVISHLRPLITKSSPSARAVVFSSDGSAPAPSSGSVIENTVRISPATSGRSQRSFCCALATLCSRLVLPSSGAWMLSASGPSRL